MNLFIIDKDPVKAAQFQCDKHVVKMPTESAQMLSVAHRMLDGYMTRGPSKSGKTIVKHWIHPDKQKDDILYKVAHAGHPCTVWTMVSSENYNWHYTHFIALCEEYTNRYGRVHESERKLKEILKNPPKNIPDGPLTQHPLAMLSNPECINYNDIVGSYRKFYQTKQARFKMIWSKRNVPEWFERVDKVLESV
jgi:hypothetical protein